jgi:hypothetical protein
MQPLINCCLVKSKIQQTFALGQTYFSPDLLPLFEAEMYSRVLDKETMEEKVDYHRGRVERVFKAHIFRGPERVMCEMKRKVSCVCVIDDMGFVLYRLHKFLQL